MTFWVWNVECWMRNIHICYFATNAPATPPQLLHEWPTFRNFAIVKQNKKNNSLDRKIFFPGQEENFEFWMLNFELSAKPILNYSILNCELEMNTESKWEIKTQTTQSQNSKTWTQNLNTELEHKTWTQNLNTKLEHKTWTKQFKIQNWTIQNRLCR